MVINDVTDDAMKIDDECVSRPGLNIWNFTASGARLRRCVNMLSKAACTHALMPVFQKEEMKTRRGKLEILTAVVHFGATVPVMNPNTGASYGIIPSGACGTEYEIASGGMLVDLAENRLGVLTVEGAPGDTAHHTST